MRSSRGEMDSNKGEMPANGDELRPGGGEMDKIWGEMQSNEGEIGSNGDELLPNWGEIVSSGGELLPNRGEMAFNGDEFVSSGDELVSNGANLPPAGARWSGFGAKPLGIQQIGQKQPPKRAKGAKRCKTSEPQMTRMTRISSPPQTGEELKARCRINPAPGESGLTAASRSCGQARVPKSEGIPQKQHVILILPKQPPVPIMSPLMDALYARLVDRPLGDSPPQQNIHGFCGRICFGD